MSLNNLKLTSSLLAELYHKVLVQADATPVPSGQPSPPLRYLGNNGKSILVVSADENVPFLNDEDLQLLTSILSACNLSLADVAIINWTNVGDHEYESISSQLENTKTVLFGVDPVSFGLPINFPHFQSQKFAGKEFLFAPSLNNLKEDKEAKKQLWTALKKIFSI